MSFHLTVDCEPEVSSSKESGELERIVKLEVSRLHTVDEVLQSVYKVRKETAGLPHELSHYGLFYTEKKTWLRNKPIGRELKGLNKAYLQFRLKVRPVTIRFLDASSQILTIDESLPVKDIVTDICKQLNLDHSEELSLVVAVDYAVDKHHPASKGEMKSPLVNPRKDANAINGEGGISPRIARKKPSSRPGSAGMFGRVRSGSANSSSHIKKQISRKHQIRIDTPWLDPNKSLKEQDVTEEDELLLMYRFYYSTQLERTSTSVEMLYKQARATFLAREMLCTHDDIPRFTAILCQIAYGDHVSKEDTQEKLHKLKKTLLPAKLKSKPFVKEVSAFHLLLNGIDAQEAKCWFLKQWSSVTSFGMEFFSCSNWETKEKGLIGVSKQQIIFLHHNTKKKNLKLDMSTLKSWELDSDTNVVSLIVLQDGVWMKLMLHFPTFYSSIFVDCLQGNREISSEIPDVQLSQKEFQFDEELEKHYSRYSQPLALDIVQRQGSGGGRRHRRTGSLTLSDVLYWSEAIETPLVSHEEKDSWKTESWENPAFENLDQLMDDRFSFLDFENEAKSVTATPSQRTHVASSPESSPNTSTTNLSKSPQVAPPQYLRIPAATKRTETLPSPLSYARTILPNATMNTNINADPCSSSSGDDSSPVIAHAIPKINND